MPCVAVSAAGGRVLAVPRGSGRSLASGGAGPPDLALCRAIGPLRPSRWRRKTESGVGPGARGGAPAPRRAPGGRGCALRRQASTVVAPKAHAASLRPSSRRSLLTEARAGSLMGTGWGKILSTLMETSSSACRTRHSWSVSRCRAGVAASVAGRTSPAGDAVVGAGTAAGVSGVAVGAGVGVVGVGFFLVVWLGADERARAAIGAGVVGAGVNSTCELGRHSARALEPYPDYRDSGVHVAGEGAGALGGATAAHQSFWDNGPRS